MNEKLETSKASGAHHELRKLAGEWEGTATTWFEPDKIADASPVRAKMRLVLDGRFILSEYRGSFAGAPLEGIALYGYHLELQKFQSAWIDSFHNGTAIMFSEGRKEDQTMALLGSYACVTPGQEQHWGWRTEIELVSDRELRIVAYNISPDGHEAKATETVYRNVE